ncbi:CPBP family intramembrane glutamic endopeptidase [Salinibacterium hongtaonis]|uniref:CPBP family intramembrane glutamic endopeptidase n=1 Tax=Homoserinimonas hongtaonis TaxID=2079791 RepID=UPI000D3503C2|nr:CPBP family intramembrane glutamic endopeptidase [Salinibacterium hongtaonis]AWB89174.1 hypothetical protein C2138_06155 [Salinibacterium hongtaonis]
MKKLRAASPIWHAVVWILAYVLIVTVGDWISAIIGVPNSATAPLVLLLSIVLVLYVTRNGWARYYGLIALRRDQFQRTLLYIPLVVLALLQFTLGLRADLDVRAVLLTVLLMLGVGFAEELVFRGFLFRALLSESTLPRAIIISGLTFGVGHLVNLARGYSGAEQIVQIAVAIVLGVVLAMLFAVSGTIVPLIAFHALFNISGDLSAANSDREGLILAATIVISAGYAAYLAVVLRKHGAHPMFA